MYVKDHSYPNPILRKIDNGKKHVRKRKNKKKNASRAAIGKKDKKEMFNVHILYDDGVKEEVTFPDPDVLLVPPGKFVKWYDFNSKLLYLIFVILFVTKRS